MASRKKAAKKAELEKTDEAPEASASEAPPSAPPAPPKAVPAKAAAPKAKDKGGYVVADGEAIVCRRGMVVAGQPIRDIDVGGAASLAALVKAAKVVKA